jgi:ectoine hydroxylase-related dioxygenase (phytanoyl-CoA dioxygenase family)
MTCGSDIVDAFAERGYAVVADVLDAGACDELAASLEAQADAIDARRWLDVDAVARTAKALTSHPVLIGLLPTVPSALQCTCFDKAPGRNWTVGPHQDLSLPLPGEPSKHSRGVSRKDGAWFVQAESNVLAQLVAVRLQLDGVDDGALEVVAGSHKLGRLDEHGLRDLAAHRPRERVAVPRGGVLVMRPLLVHSSRKLTSGHRRRVLHFLFGPSVPDLAA